VIASLVAAIALAAYAWSVRTYDRRYPERRIPIACAACFGAGVLAIAAALSPPVDALADVSFAAHMMQHLVLTLIAAPLVLLGRPLLIVVALLPRAASRRIAGALHRPPLRSLASPALGWLAFVGTLWIVHVSPLYEASLAHPAVHVLEHGLLLAVALLFWLPVIAAGYSPHPMPPSTRALYVFAAIPPGAFLGFAIYAAARPWYEHYAAGRNVADVLQDQRDAGVAMWLGGGLLLLIAALALTAAWASAERREVNA
jgi:putative membrane protein